MRTTAITDSLTWLSSVNPTDAELRSLKNEFFIHPVIMEELSAPTNRSKVETHDGYLYLVYHLPIYNTETRTSRPAEIDIIATETALITITYEELEPIREFERVIGKIPERNLTSTAELVYHLIETANEFSLRQLRHVEDKVRAVGVGLFKNSGRKLLEDISLIKRDLLEFSLIVASQRVMLESLLTTGTAFWGEAYRIYLSDLWGDFLKAHSLLENLRATIESYSETISQLFELKTAEVVRRFSILGFLAVPLVLYATIALEPTVASTFIRSATDFWEIFGVVAAFVGILAFIFRKKGWL